MEPEQFTVRGEPVEQATIVRIWEEIKREIAGKYPVGNIKMPNIKAHVLNRNHFRKVVRKLLWSQHIIDTSEIEWGTKCTKPSAVTFLAEGEWIILKCKGYGFSLEDDLRHELLHVWEAKLGLKWGTLTQTESCRHC